MPRILVDTNSHKHQVDSNFSGQLLPSAGPLEFISEFRIIVVHVLRQA